MNGTASTASRLPSEPESGRRRSAAPRPPVINKASTGVEALCDRRPSSSCLSSVAALIVRGRLRRRALQPPGRARPRSGLRPLPDLPRPAIGASIRPASARGAWDAVLDNMKGFGLRISADQRATILDYLGTYLGPKPPPAGGGGSGGGGGRRRRRRQGLRGHLHRLPPAGRQGQAGRVPAVCRQSGPVPGARFPGGGRAQRP